MGVKREYLCIYILTHYQNEMDLRWKVFKIF